MTVEEFFERSPDVATNTTFWLAFSPFLQAFGNRSAIVALWNEFFHREISKKPLRRYLSGIYSTRTHGGARQQVHPGRSWPGLAVAVRKHLSSFHDHLQRTTLLQVHPFIDICAPNSCLDVALPAVDLLYLRDKTRKLLLHSHTHAIRLRVMLIPIRSAFIVNSSIPSKASKLAMENLPSSNTNTPSDSLTVKSVLEWRDRKLPEGGQCDVWTPLEDFFLEHNYTLWRKPMVPGDWDRFYVYPPCRDCPRAPDGFVYRTKYNSESDADDSNRRFPLTVSMFELHRHLTLTRRSCRILYIAPHAHPTIVMSSSV